MSEMTRREIIGGAVGTTGILAAGILSSGMLAASASGNEETKAMNLAFSQHSPKPLPFKAGKLKGLSEKLVNSHWENNYGGAVKALNAVESKLLSLAKDKDVSPSIYGGYKREQLIKQGSVVLHEKYFGNLGGDGKPSGEIKAALEKAFDGFAHWEAEFRKTGMSLAGGSGWAVLSYNTHLNRLENNWSWDHMHNAAGGLPLLVLDMYEHAFHMDYGAAAAKYVDAFMDNVHWEEVNRRYAAIQKIRTV